MRMGGLLEEQRPQRHSGRIQDKQIDAAPQNAEPHTIILLFYGLKKSDSRGLDPRAHSRRKLEPIRH
jgi:hypothetical protein